MKESISIVSESDTIFARRRGREMARSAGFNLVDQTRIAIGISELSRNIVLYARKGKIEIEIVRCAGTLGIEIRAIDEGPGIPDLDKAMLDGYSTSAGLGMGLPGTKRIMDEFSVDTAIGSGTKVMVRKWLNKELY
ncbi:serine/threonine protein kinase [Gordoniibacillus kamchatkensis]|uniref:Serine/threonine protein kinase n=1 Tax=Gordoniibacillus kamchatkensis TaxID=1590651 RepID=A0ABR5ACW8_9BACL|nr:anti-sigma regulatory factor [Paenibacillus sp. VKM B-2647]KIL38894.1 serine/threonine protein kinase [Paenibacillus sp. VKM B-2647]